MNRPQVDADTVHSGRKRLVWRAVTVLACLICLGGAFLAGALVYRDRDTIRAWLKKSKTGIEVIESEFYSIAVEKLKIPAQGRDGSIDAVADGILFVNRLGESWYIDKGKKLRKLGLRVPVNYDEFAADPHNANTSELARFAVKDILVQKRENGIRLLASHNFWRSSEDCYMLRVSSLEITEEDLVDSNAGVNSGWRTVFDTVPCRGLTPRADGKGQMPTLGAGGRLVALTDSAILLSVGGFGPETVTEESAAPPSGPRSYGSTVLIDLETSESRNYTQGHRNPQGLATGLDGKIWLTDHGARGGDELNRIIEGRDYGHPSVSYGTEYESFLWRRNPRQGRHEGYEKPIFAWIPSIATSQLAIVKKSLFANWHGDLLVSSLKAKTLFRVRIEDDRVVFVEPMLIGHRIRDIVESSDGAIVLKTDDDFLVFLRPIDATTVYRMDLPPETRGEVLASSCASCHAMSPDGLDGIGPNLWRVVGRPIASREGFGYSPALRSLEGDWTEESLRQFLGDPEAFAPGSTMAMTTDLSKREIDDVIVFLARLR